MAVIDIVSPCVTFNNHDTSTKSYGWGKDNEIPMHELNYVPHYEEIEIDEYDDELEVELHDGSYIVLKKLEEDYDPTDKMQAIQTLEKAHQEQKMLTGLFYVDESKPDMMEMLNMVDEPLSAQPEERMRPSREALAAVMATF